MRPCAVSPRPMHEQTAFSSRLTMSHTHDQRSCPDGSPLCAWLQGLTPTYAGRKAHQRHGLMPIREAAANSADVVHDVRLGTIGRRGSPGLTVCRINGRHRPVAIDDQTY